MTAASEHEYGPPTNTGVLDSGQWKGIREFPNNVEILLWLLFLK